MKNLKVYAVPLAILGIGAVGLAYQNNYFSEAIADTNEIPAKVVERPALKGAFGITLGEEINISNTSLYEENKKSKLQEFKYYPEVKFRGYETYSIKTTPKTNLAYSILAKQDTGNLHNCKQELDVVSKMIVKKYGRQGVKTQRDNEFEIFSLIKDDRRIDIFCTPNNYFGEITIQYSDTKLLSETTKEMVEENSIDLL